MSTESDHNDPNGAAAADDPFAGWAEALEEQKSADAQAVEADQGGPLSGEPARPFGGNGNAADEATATDRNHNHRTFGQSRHDF